MAVAQRADYGSSASTRDRFAPISPTAGAIVIGGDYRGLGAVRSLGRRGIPVWVAKGNHSVATHSRYSRRTFEWPDGDDDAQVSLLLSLSAETAPDRWVLIPTSDETVALLAKNYDALNEHFVVSTGEWTAAQTAYDKRLTYDLAQSLGVATPWTYYPWDRKDVERLECSFPVIIKPSVKRGVNALTHEKAWRADDRETLITTYEAARKLMPASDLMIQEMIPGGGSQQFSFAALAEEGRSLVSVVACRARQYPLDFGRHTTCAVSIEDSVIEDLGRRVVAGLNHTGLIEIEFKRDPRDGATKLLDINARVWGWHTIGQGVGADFVYLLWRLLSGEQIPEYRFPPGLVWVRLCTDLPTALTEIRMGQLSPRTYIRSLMRRLNLAVAAVDDPIPAIVDLPLLFRLWLRRRAL